MILVVGATGSVGGRIAGQLLERGEAVRVLVRSRLTQMLMVRCRARGASTRSPS